MASWAIASSIRSSYRALTASSSDRKAEARCSSVAGGMSEAAANRLSCSRCQKKLATKDETIIKTATVQKIISFLLNCRKLNKVTPVGLVAMSDTWIVPSSVLAQERREMNHFLRCPSLERDRLGGGLTGSGIGVSMAAKTPSVGSCII